MHREHKTPSDCKQRLVDQEGCQPLGGRGRNRVGEARLVSNLEHHHLHDPGG